MDISEFFKAMWSHAPDFASQALLVVGTLVLGVVLALVSRIAIRWAIRRFGLETLAERIGISKLLYAIGIQRGVAYVAGEVAFYTTLALTLHSAAQYLGLPGLSDMLARVIGFIPALVAALAILAAGVIGAEFISKLVFKLAQRKDTINSPVLLGRIIYYSVIVLAGSMAAEQLGLETTLINNLIAIVAAASSFGVALAFALGAKVAFQNLMARYYITQTYRVGDHVEVVNSSGTIITFSPTGVVLQSGSEEVIVPCSVFLEHAVHLRRVASTPDVTAPLEDEEEAP